MTTAAGTSARVTEPSAWLRGAAGARIRHARRLGFTPDAPTGPVVIAAIVGGMPAPGTPDDRTCDRCGRYCGPGEDFFVFTYYAAAALVLIGGLCADHAAAEGVNVP